MQLRRNRSTRSLWDPNYVDETWINDRVQLVPRLRNWAGTYYPGTLTGITEYNWGAEGHINGATTQADIYGIFGREGLDMAARWTTPAASTPTFKAMKMYRNYDGQKSAFGETSVRAAVPNPDNLSAFAALRASDGALTLMVVSKVLSGTTPVNINLANFAPGRAAQVWQLTASNAIKSPARHRSQRHYLERDAARTERHTLRHPRGQRQPVAGRVRRRLAPLGLGPARGQLRRRRHRPTRTGRSPLTRGTSATGRAPRASRPATPTTRPAPTTHA